MKFALLAILFIPYTLYAQSDSLASRTEYQKRELESVKVSAAKQRSKQFVESTQMGKIDLSVAMLTKAPAIGGEPDIIKALQLTPGVKRGTEGGIGMYVRGGGNDENLILLDGASVYNAGHLLGFFSVFNSQSLKDVQMYKSSFPAQYGGRLSSVLDIRTKEGSLTDYKANASIGMIASSMTLQGPIIKDKLSFIVSGRRTYIDKVFRYIPYHFYDVNAKLTYVINKENRIYLSGYKGEDVLSMTSTGKDSTNSPYELQSGMKIGNNIMTLRWNNTPRNGKYIAELALLYTGFRYHIQGRMNNNALDMQSAIRDLGIKGDIKTYTGAKHRMTAGFSLINHYFNPNIVNSTGAALEAFGNKGGKQIYNTEGAVYLNDDYTINEKWQLAGGMRLSLDQVGTSTYINPEPRLAARYLINSQSSVKLSYARMVQYMHLVSSSSLALPTDLWYPVTPLIRPGKSDQVSAGYYYTFPSVGINITAEAYYKWMHNLIEYREGALLILNDNYEKELLKGEGHSYGIELFITKTSGRFTGWAGYSLSYAHRHFDSLNNGKEYYARYDRRHDFSLVGMYDITSKWSASSTILYATGTPFTGQLSQYMAPKPDLTGVELLPAYSGRNEMRLSSSFRIDLDVQYKFRLSKRIKGDAHLSIYNLLNRTQPGRVERIYNEQKGEYTYQQKGLFGTITTGTINFNL